MASVRDLRAVGLALAALSLSACGFRPLYAVNEDGGEPGLRTVRLVAMEASDIATPALTREFERRTARAGASEADYDLTLKVREVAQPLAVQIDDSVTRYNYRFQADYRLTRRDTGKEIKGTAEAVASFNVVSSQYSTLYAEEAAREKAARMLAEEVERDILLKFAAAREPGEAAAAEAIPAKSE